MSGPMGLGNHVWTYPFGHKKAHPAWVTCPSFNQSQCEDVSDIALVAQEESLLEI